MVVRLMTTTRARIWSEPKTDKWLNPTQILTLTMSGYYGHPQPGNYPNQQFIPPQQNIYPQYTQFQQQQQPSPVFATPPGHAASGYFPASPVVP
jgi:hypothetical protein